MTRNGPKRVILKSTTNFYGTDVKSNGRLGSLQSLTGKYRGLQGNPCNENRDPVIKTGVPCNEKRFFLVRIDLQGLPCKPYSVWVYSALLF